MSDNLNFSFSPLDIADLGASSGLDTNGLDPDNTAWMLLTPASTPGLNPTEWRSYNELSPHEAYNLLGQAAGSPGCPESAQEVSRLSQVPQVPQVPQARLFRLAKALLLLLLEWWSLLLLCGRRLHRTQSCALCSLCTMRSLNSRWRRSSQQPSRCLATSRCDSHRTQRTPPLLRVRLSKLSKIQSELIIARIRCIMARHSRGRLRA